MSRSNNHVKCTKGEISEMKHPHQNRISFLVLLGCAFLAIAPAMMLCADFLKAGADALELVSRDRLFRMQIAHSVFYTLLSSSLGLLTALPLALSIYLLNSRPLRLILSLLLFALFLPEQVAMLPQYILMERLDLLDTPWAVVLSCIFQPYSVLLLSLGMRLIPRAAYEQFRLESNSLGALFGKVILPYLAPVILVCFTLEWAQFWNMLDAPLLYLESEEYMPLSVGLFRYRAGDGAELSSAAFLYLVPPLLLLLFVCGILSVKYILRGRNRYSSMRHFPVRHTPAQWSAKLFRTRESSPQYPPFRKKAIPLLMTAGICAAVGIWLSEDRGGDERVSQTGADRGGDGTGSQAGADRGEQGSQAGRGGNGPLSQEQAGHASDGEVILGIRQADQTLEECVAAFNEGGYGCHVTLRSYAPDEPNLSEEAVNLRLYADLTSGDGPDLMVFHVSDMELWASAGGLEDLTPYLAESELLSRQDFVESVAEACTCEGKLLCLPRWVSIQTLWAKEGLVDTAAGWTVSDLLTLMEQNPHIPLTGSLTREDFLNYCLAYMEESLWTEQEQEEMALLQRILELAAAFPEQAEHVPLQEECHLLHRQEALFMDWGFDSWEIFRMMKVYSSGDQPVPVGYPAPDGIPRAMLYPHGLYAIPANASNKEGAWIFLEHFLAGELDPQPGDNGETPLSTPWGIPVLKRELEEAFLREEQRTEYLGIELPPFAERQIVQDLLSMAEIYESPRGQILEIIREEMHPYFEGTKNLDATMEIIRRRVDLYLGENR